MIEISYKKKLQKEGMEQLVVCYNLLSEKSEYSIECFLENATEKNIRTYYKADGFTKNRKEAIAFVEKIAKYEMLPIHLPDLLMDEFE